MSRRTWMLAGTGLLVLGLSTVIVLLYQRQARAAELDSARGQAVDAAKSRLPQLLSYDFHTIDRDMERARALTMGDFHDQFSDLASKVIEPAAKEREIVTKTTVTGSSVVSAQPQQVVLLLFLDQVTQSKSDKQSHVDGARVRVTLRQSDNQWLVSALTPV